jgi:bifunctional enzyme CysN/CysC/sulfate adenylyltransferase subunit 1
MTTATLPEKITQFDEFLDQHLERGLLRFSTAGSVDDGKSTLIGRLLHDTQGIYDDQLAALKSSRLNRSTGPIDFSLLTDGLRAEREQGITIDVAYRYFSTSKRKFIIADTPGHEQYTRNMATGASTADLAIVLIDAIAFERNGGLLPQSRRHTFLASLLGIPHVVAAVNKMDLAGYSEERFRAIDEAFQAFATELGLHQKSATLAIPLSALAGDNIVERSVHMPWYTGPTLLEHLESVELDPRNADAAPLRFPIQLVLRPDANFRGYAGQVASGTIHAGDQVVALPSLRKTRVRRIVTYDGDLAQARHGQSVALELEDQIDLSRGEMLVSPGDLPQVSRHFLANVVWMHEDPLTVGSSYLVKHSTRSVRATVTAIRHRVDIHTMEKLPATTLGMNDIAEVEFEAAKPLFFDNYHQNRDTGNFILIDPLTNATVGAAMIEQALDSGSLTQVILPVLVQLPGQPELALRLATALRSHGRAVVDLDDQHIGDEGFSAAVRATQLAGAIGITRRTRLPKAEIESFIEAEQIISSIEEEELSRRLNLTDSDMDWSI